MNAAAYIILGLGMRGPGPGSGGVSHMDGNCFKMVYSSGDHETVFSRNKSELFGTGWNLEISPPQNNI